MQVQVEKRLFLYTPMASCVTSIQVCSPQSSQVTWHKSRKLSCCLYPKRKNDMTRCARVISSRILDTRHGRTADYRGRTARASEREIGAQERIAKTPAGLKCEAVHFLSLFRAIAFNGDSGSLARAGYIIGLCRRRRSLFTAFAQFFFATFAARITRWRK